MSAILIEELAEGWLVTMEPGAVTERRIACSAGGQVPGHLAAVGVQVSPDDTLRAELLRALGLADERTDRHRLVATVRGLVEMAARLAARVPDLEVPSTPDNVAAAVERALARAESTREAEADFCDFCIEVGKAFGLDYPHGVGPADLLSRARALGKIRAGLLERFGFPADSAIDADHLLARVSALVDAADAGDEEPEDPDAGGDGPGPLKKHRRRPVK